MALFCLFDLKLSFGLLWSKWFSSVCFLWWCVLFVFYIWYLFCFSLLCTHSLECLLPSANGLIWSGGSKLTSWAGDKMMKLHSQNNQGGIFSLKRESWRRGHRIQHGNSDLVSRSLWLFGGILIIFFRTWSWYCKLIHLRLFCEWSEHHSFWYFLLTRHKLDNLRWYLRLTYLV